jgi:pyruvate/2-oxoglutarate dehydrogenase complex dihydrolipoamide dehydrogenase (E3) component
MTAATGIHDDRVMTSSAPEPFDVVVVGAGPAGVVAALRAARLGAKTALITRDQFGGMAANDGPVPVRTLAHAARLIREARQLPRYGIESGEPALDYPRLLARVREVTAATREQTLLRDDLDQAGVRIHEQAGPARFADAHTVESDHAPRLHADKVILCPGGTSRPLPVPGFELTATHSDAWNLSSVPPSMMVIGAGATGVQVASIFNALGSHVYLVEIAPRILMSEDHEVSETVGAALAASGVDIVEDAGTIDHFERCPTGVRLLHSSGQGQQRIEATLAVVAAGWAANTTGLHLDRAGVLTDRRGYVEVDPQLRTSARHVFAAGDVTGRAMVVHEAVRQGLLAATNAVLGGNTVLPAQVSPIGSFTDPEYASVGLTEAAARRTREATVATVRFDSLPRPIIDGRQTGFCKLVIDRELHTILGCHVVGERAVELVQLAATAMAAQMPVEQLALVPFSFPTYANALGRAAMIAAVDLDHTGMWAIDHLEAALEAGVA